MYETLVLLIVHAKMSDTSPRNNFWNNCGLPPDDENESSLATVSTFQDYFLLMSHLELVNSQVTGLFVYSQIKSQRL